MCNHETARHWPMAKTAWHLHFVPIWHFRTRNPSLFKANRPIWPSSQSSSLHTMKLLHLLPLLLVLVLQSTSSVSSSYCNFPAVINLGDSNSDTGGLSATFGPVPPPYGRTTFGMPAGRYSDGRLIIDFIGKQYSGFYMHIHICIFGHDVSLIMAWFTCDRSGEIGIALSERILGLVRHGF